MTVDILTIIRDTAAEAVTVEDIDVKAGMARLRELGIDPDPLPFLHAVIAAFILADLEDDPANVHRYIEHSVHGRTLDKAVILNQTEEARLEAAVAVLAASASESAA